MGEVSEFDAMNRALHADLDLPGASQECLEEQCLRESPSEEVLPQRAPAETLHTSTLEEILAELGEESSSALLNIYLGTSSHLLPGTAAETDLIDISDMSRQELSECLRDCFDNPAVQVLGSIT